MTEVLETHRPQVAELCRQVGARRLDVFGSAARGEFNPESSDLDFLVELDALPPARYASAFFALKEGLERLFGRPVDLVTESGLGNPYFRERVRAERRTLYAR
jgi:predicted nucleotidyltransferase